MKSAMIAPYSSDAKQLWDYMMTVRYTLAII